MGDLKIPLVYIAGPYRAPSHWQIEQNIQRARNQGAIIACLGAYPVIPHANTSHFGGLLPETINEDEFFLSGTLALMLRCDAVFAIPGWGASLGASEEVKRAGVAHIPVFEDASSISEWIKAWQKHNDRIDRWRGR